MKSLFGILKRLRRDGPAKTLRDLWKDHIYRVDHDVIITLDLAGNENTHPAAAYGMEFFAIKATDDPAFERMGAAFPTKKQAVAKEIDAGRMLFSIEREGQCLGVILAAFEDFFDANLYRVQMEIAPHQVYMYSYLVAPEARRSRAARSLASEALSWVFGQGRTEVIAICLNEERALFRFYMALGFKPTGKAIDLYHICHTRWPRWTRHRPTSKARHIG